VPVSALEVDGAGGGGTGRALGRWRRVSESPWQAATPTTTFHLCITRRPAAGTPLRATSPSAHLRNPSADSRSHTHTEADPSSGSHTQRTRAPRLLWRLLPSASGHRPREGESEMARERWRVRGGARETETETTTTTQK
jgi:hypothetical protein